MRYTVAFRKMGGKIKGGSRDMRRMSAPVTCIMTWRAQDRIVADETAGLIWDR